MKEAYVLWVDVDTQLVEPTVNMEPFKRTSDADSSWINKVTKFECPESDSIE